MVTAAIIAIIIVATAISMGGTESIIIIPIVIIDTIGMIAGTVDMTLVIVMTAPATYGNI